MLGKEKCKALKEIRKQIAEKNDIEYAISECSHKGDCKGTCPKCEAELRYLERELEKRTKLGKAVVVAGLSTIATIGMTGCNEKNNDSNALAGDVVQVTTTEEQIDGGLEEYPGDYTTEIDTPTTTEEELIEIGGDVYIDPSINDYNPQSGTITN